MAQYRVAYFQDNTWEVLKDNETVFQGSLADCEAWVRLEEGGML